MIQIAEVVVSEYFSFIEGSLSYAYDTDVLDLKVGDTVQVPFGQKKTLSGLVIQLRPLGETDDMSKIKSIISKLSYALPELCVQVAQGISEYYFAPIQKCLRLFLPPKIWKGEYLIHVPKYWKVIDANQKITGKKQLEVFEYLEKKGEVEESVLREQTGASLVTLRTLEEKGIIAKEEKKISKVFEMNVSEFKQLTDEQQEVLEALKKKHYSLLQGVTGSGKTEVFLHFFQWVFQQSDENQCLFLVPEIALTPQMISYFKNVFPQGVEVIHSQVSEGEKCRIWTSVASGETRLVIGSRSALFMSWRHLKCIVMDEAHEWTYKSDQTPRFHAKKVAEMLLGKDDFLILSSATPDIADRFLADKGDIQLLELKNRIHGDLPPVSIVDLRQEYARKNFSPFSLELQHEINIALQNKKQVILFLNKRGFAKSLQCRSCGHIHNCKDCDIPLTHHQDLQKGNSKLICHYCFLLQRVPDLCENCGTDALELKGTGTQKVEQELAKLFPTARVLRADRDTTSNKGSFEDMYNAMKNGDADILLGTQMISKGLDLPNVELVGIINADQGLHIPDFRSSEKVFQLLMQVAGRSGRAGTGKVVLQTYQPFHEMIQAASSHSYKKMYDQIIEEREHLLYPPFAEVVKLTFVHPSKVQCMQSAAEMKKALTGLKNSEGLRITSAPSFIPKMAGKYYWNIVIRGNDVGAFFKEFREKNLDTLIGWRIDRDPVFLS